MSPSFHTYLSATTASLAIAMAFASVPAHAQDRGTDNAAVETILITARKRVETLQNVPISVTAYSNAALEQRDITNLQGLNNFTPNLELTTGRADGGGSAAQIYIRGVGQSDFIFPNDPGVGLYVDDVYLARTVGGLIALADVERVEVLRGPQGTLYGKNTIGGAVKVITKAPTGEWGGKIRLTAGNFDRRDAVASVDVPILDTLAMRVELASLQRDGFVIRPFDGIDLGNEDKKLLRADMLWEPTPKLTVRMQGDVQSQRQNGAPGNLLTIIPSTAGATPVDPVNGQPVINPITNQQAFVPGTGIIEGLYNPVVVPGLNAGLGLPEGTLYDGRFVTGDARTSNGTAFVNDDNDIWGLSLNINYEISDNLSIKSITAYRNLDANFARDGDHTPYAIVDTNNTFQQEQISQEFQLSGLSFSDRFNWLVGGFAFFENASDDNTVSLLEGTLEAVGLELSLRPISSIKSQSFAIFTHGDFDVTDRLSISAGLRFTYEEKELQRIFTLRSSGVVITDRRNGNPDSGDPLAAVGPALEENWSAFAPKVGLDYQLNEDVLLYASASRGFKSGGWSPRPQIGTENQPFDQEFLNSFEIGAKTQWFDRRLTVNGAAFFNIYEDIQLTTVSSDSSGQLVLPVFNAGEAQIYGAELEIQAKPTPQWDISMGLGLLSTKYTELDPGTGIQPDANLPDAPAVTFNATAQYTWPIADAGDLSLRGGLAYKSETFKDPFNTAPLTQEGYWLLDASLAFVTADGRWRIAVNGTNLTNETYITNGLNVDAFGYFEAYYGRPREWSFNATMNF